MSGGEVVGRREDGRVCREGDPASRFEIAHKRTEKGRKRTRFSSSSHHYHRHQFKYDKQRTNLNSPIPMMLTVTPFEFAAEYDPEGVTDGDSLRTIARGPTATVEGGRRAVVVAVMLSVTLALVL
jgi:hypothetical protein